MSETIGYEYETTDGDVCWADVGSNAGTPSVALSVCNSGAPASGVIHLDPDEADALAAALTATAAEVRRMREER